MLKPIAFRRSSGEGAHEELLQLMRQRPSHETHWHGEADIVGLANLFGEQVLGDDLLELIDRKPTGRQPGFTKAVPEVLMEVRRPLGAREVAWNWSDMLRQSWRGTRPAGLGHYRLNRLVIWRGPQLEQRPRATRVGMDQRHRPVADAMPSRITA